MGMSPAGVMKKVKKLEEAGIVKGYTALVDHSKLGKPYKYIIMVKTQAGKHSSVAKEIGEVLGSSVLEVYTITGIYDVIVKVLAGDATELNSIISKIHSIPGVTETVTSLVLETVEEKPSLVPEGIQLPIRLKELESE
ncbi:MAG: hypothetical protein DRO05_00105 [Thermoproteota archaeon]|nr:MAG: hypothetical protein DRO05_00105 [Candidatus Korarchaeota archaeon]